MFIYGIIYFFYIYIVLPGSIATYRNSCCGWDNQRLSSHTDFHCRFDVLLYC